MKIEKWPNFIALKISQLDAQAKTLAAHAEILVIQAEYLNDELNGRTASNTPLEALRGEFERVLKAASEAQVRQQVEEGVHAACRKWMDDLPADAKLEAVPIGIPTDATLASVRALIKAAQDEIVTLQRAPVPAKDIGQRIKAYVHKLADAGRPLVYGISEGEELRIVWPQYARVNRDRPHLGYLGAHADALLLAAYLSPNALIDKLMAEAEATAAEPLPVAKRQPRIAALAEEIERLQRIEEAIISANGGERQAGRPAPVVLGCKVEEVRGARAA